MVTLEELEAEVKDLRVMFANHSHKKEEVDVVLVTEEVSSDENQPEETKETKKEEPKPSKN